MDKETVMAEKKIFPMLNNAWCDAYGKPKKLWHGGYSKLENPFKINQRSGESYKEAIIRSQGGQGERGRKNMSVPVEDCGFDKRLTKKFWKNGIKTLGDVHYKVMAHTNPESREWENKVLLQAHKDFRKKYTEGQHLQIGSIRHDSGVYGDLSAKG